MKISNYLCTVLLAISALSPFVSHAQVKELPSQNDPQTIEMTDGEIRKIDKENQKITIKHKEIKNLDMPGMTMVFKAGDPTFIENFKAGDKIKFTAEKLDGAIVVTTMVLLK